VLNAAGGFADLMTVPAGQAVEVPDALERGSRDARRCRRDGDGAAEVIAATGAVRSRRRRRAGRAPPRGDPARPRRSVVVVEPHDERRALLAALGHRVVPTIDVLDSPVPVVADCAGAPAAVAPALELLEPRGTFVLVGYTRLDDFDAAPIARKELTLRGVRSGSKPHLEAVLRLAARRAIRLPPATTWSIADINAAFEALREGRVAGKAVVVNPET
jgi:D-arabinose 1-dehydrogenase-like Zn-dependent alcohol dehydrogenase